MKLIVQCVVSHPDWEGCEFAFVDLTPELASLILRRKASRENLALSDRDVSEVHYHHYGPLYFRHTDEGPVFDAIERCYTDEPDPWTLVPDLQESDFEGLANRTECDRMVVGRDGFWWECYPKHCDPVVETREIPYAVAEKAAMEVTANA
jgi:hypothetical protein